MITAAAHCVSTSTVDSVTYRSLQEDNKKLSDRGKYEKVHKVNKVEYGRILSVTLVELAP